MGTAIPCRLKLIGSKTRHKCTSYCLSKGWRPTIFVSASSTWLFAGEVGVPWLRLWLAEDAFSTSSARKALAASRAAASAWAFGDAGAREIFTLTIAVPADIWNSTATGACVILSSECLNSSAAAPTDSKTSTPYMALLPPEDESCWRPFSLKAQP